MQEDWGAITAAWPITGGCGGVSRGEQVSRGATVVLWGVWTTGQRGEPPSEFSALLLLGDGAGLCLSLGLLCRLDTWA